MPPRPRPRPSLRPALALAGLALLALLLLGMAARPVLQALHDAHGSLGHADAMAFHDSISAIDGLDLDADLDGHTHPGVGGTLHALVHAVDCGLHGAVLLADASVMPASLLVAGPSPAAPASRDDAPAGRLFRPPNVA